MGRDDGPLKWKLQKLAHQPLPSVIEITVVPVEMSPWSAWIPDP